MKLYSLFGDAQQFRMLKDSKLKKAERDAQNLCKACKAYRISADGFPKKLLDLAVPPEGSRPFVEGGKSAVIDPWGRAYKLEIVTDAAGDKLPVVSTMSPYGDGKQEIRWPKKEK
jgi:hypothetical protein